MAFLLVRRTSHISYVERYFQSCKQNCKNFSNEEKNALSTLSDGIPPCPAYYAHLICGKVFSKMQTKLQKLSQLGEKGFIHIIRWHSSLSGVLRTSINQCQHCHRNHPRHNDDYAHLHISNVNIGQTEYTFLLPSCLCIMYMGVKQMINQGNVVNKVPFLPAHFDAEICDKFVCFPENCVSV